MRLLKRLQGRDDFELISVDDENPPPYAILSHTWITHHGESQEVTYHELLVGSRKDKAGWEKIRFCAEKAEADQLEHFWIDTCCIDKSTSAELSTAINSMYRWYERSTKCYVYLADVSSPSDTVEAESLQTTWKDEFRQSRWFTRGWTLQELAAPTSVQFFSREGLLLGDKVSLIREIYFITKIPVKALLGEPVASFSIEERMSWIIGRTTTCREDKVYCLLGLFGVFLPPNYGEGEAYAALRLKEEIQKRHGVQDFSSLKTMAVPSILPFPRNEHFTGRGSELEQLERCLFISDSHRRMTVYGLGGCGKSALAIEFAYRTLVRDPERRVFWVPAFSRDSFERAFREIGTQLRVPGIADDKANVFKLVKDALSSKHLSWLMIIDNADDRSVLFDAAHGDLRSLRLYDYLPYSHRGSILCTSRNRKVAGDLTPSSVLELSAMSNSDAGKLLAQRVPRQTLLDNEAKVDELLQILTYLPLAIVQASAFMNNNDVSISEYISLFQDTSAASELLSETTEDPSRYRELDSTIAKTWHICFNQLSEQDQLAADYLSFMACLDYINVPQSLLPQGPSPVQQVKALGTLKAYAFITERQRSREGLSEERCFDMHRLVHMASVAWLQEHNKWTHRTCSALSRLIELIPCHGGPDSIGVWRPYLAHAVHVAELDSVVDEAEQLRLLDRAGHCQSSLGRYSSADLTFRTVLSRGTNLLAEDHPLIANASIALGGALMDQGRYVEAEAILRQISTRMDEASCFGPEHPDTLISMSTLGAALINQLKYGEAELILRQTLTRQETHAELGPEHPHTLHTMRAFADVLRHQRRYNEAEDMGRHVLSRHKKLFGTYHSHTLQSMHVLSVVLGMQGKYNEAEALQRQSLAAITQLLGPEHPITLQISSNLTVSLICQDEYVKAEETIRLLFPRQEFVLGHTHRFTLRSKSNLAAVLVKQNKYEEGEALHRETLAQHENVLGPAHPDTLRSVDLLCACLEAQLRFDEALALLQTTIIACGNIIGKDHYSTRFFQALHAEVENKSTGRKNQNVAVEQTNCRNEGPGERIRQTVS